MGCTQSSAATKATKADMGDRKGVGHTERMGSKNRAARKGIGHTERMGRTGRAGLEESPEAPQSRPPPPPPGLDFNDGAELDEDGIMTAAEVGRRTSKSVRVKEVFLGDPAKELKDRTRVRYAFWTQRGYYPDDKNKANQDAYSVTHNFAGLEGDSVFAVYDGHGRFGHDCADFAKKDLPKVLAKHVRQERIRLHKAKLKADAKAGKAKQKGAFNPKLWPLLNQEQYEKVCRKALLECNRNMHKSSEADDTLSGTTAICAGFHNGRVTICNVGDSRAVLGCRWEKAPIVAAASREGCEEEKEEEKEEIEPISDCAEDGADGNIETSALDALERVDAKDGSILALPLSQDQTPYRPDERERVKRCGARVRTVDQMEGLEPIHENWGKTSGEDIDEIGDPPRIWRMEEDFPGTAFTRSLGDTVAEELGVTAEPEIVTRELGKNDKILVIASDGVFEFVTNQRVIDICSDCFDPLEACQRVVAEAYKQWLHYELRTDDITIIVLFIECNKESSDEARSTGELLSLAKTQGQKPMKAKVDKNGGNTRTDSMHLDEVDEEKAVLDESAEA